MSVLWSRTAWGKQFRPHMCTGLGSEGLVLKAERKSKHGTRGMEVRSCLEIAGKVPLQSIGALVAAASSGAANTAASISPRSVAISTLTEVAVTAVAIASGACLSTRVDHFWPQKEEAPAFTEQMIVDSVDVTGFRIFEEAEVQKAISYARDAHSGQMRKTGEPYITHCIHTAKILAALVPQKGKRAVDTVVAGVLHDVVDDTGQNLKDLKEHFTDDVVKLVAGVSKLSHINQLLRRHRRTSTQKSSPSTYGITPTEVDSLRVMLLGMVADPRIVLIKLADRLHNMRTIYALPPSKALAVAHETLAIWCSLASSLGVWAVKSELEDLCFAVLQPHIFRKLRAELATMWSPHKDWRYLRKTTKRAKRRALLYSGNGLDTELGRKDDSEDEELAMQDLLESVVPFDVLLDRNKRIHMVGSHKKSGSIGRKKTKLVHDAEVGLGSLATCEEALERELLISTSYVPGMEFTLSGRLKSLYSTYCKMKRKGVGVDQVYDARALRVVIGDGGMELHAQAVEGCYNILSIVHSLWHPIDGEFDDYIVNPKTSGYQSLHTAVQGPDGAPLEVQIRTQGMHEYAECGHAAHWVYKEDDSSSMEPATSFMTPSGHLNFEVNNLTKQIKKQYTDATDTKQLNKLVKVGLPAAIQLGHPALRVEDGRLLAAVIMRMENDKRELLVAISFALHAREAVAAGRLGDQRRRWNMYAELYKKVLCQWWFAPGHGDWSTCLEKYTLCRDGIYHKQDQFGRSLPTYIQLLDLSRQEQEEYWEIMNAVLEGGPVGVDSYKRSDKTARTYSQMCISTTTQFNKKVRLLRSMLQWEQELHHEAAMHRSLNILNPNHPESVTLTDVLIIRWPDGQIMQMPSGSTAADAAHRMGMDGKFIFVNGNIVLPHMLIKTGDIVEVRM